MLFYIVSRANSRRTSYTKKDLHARLRLAGYHFIEEGALTKVQVQTVEERSHLEYNLRLVHRNIGYRIEA
jgi:hypothetical protein